MASATADASYVLVGSPEARHTAARPAEAAPAAAAVAAPTGEDLMDADFSKATAPAPAAKGGKTLTENLSPTFVSSGDPCLDFFFHVVPGTPASSVESLLTGAWAADPATALRLVANLRGVRGSGTSPTARASTPPRSGSTHTTRARSRSTPPSGTSRTSPSCSTRSCTAGRPRRA